MTCNIFQVVTQAVNEGANDRGKPLVDGHIILDKKYFALFNDDYSRRMKEKYGVSSEDNVFTTKPIETKAGRPDVYGYSKTYQENRWFFNEPLLKELEKKMIEFETANRLKKEKLEKVVALAQNLESIAAFSLKSMDTVEQALSEIAEQLKASPSEAMTARNSVGEEIANIALELFPAKDTNVAAIKKGVPELFESNPELADAVYEALGFKQTIVTEIGTVFKEPSEFSQEDYDTLKDMGYTEDEILDKLGAKKSETVLAQKAITPQQKQQAQQLYSQYLDTTTTPTIEGFKAFAQGTTKATETNLDTQEALQDFRDENSNMPDEDIDDYFFSCEI